MDGAHSIMAPHGIFGPQPGSGQDQAGSRAGRQIHDPAALGLGEALVSGARGQGRLSLRPGRHRARSNGLSGVHRSGHFAHSRQRAGHGSLLSVMLSSA